MKEASKSELGRFFCFSGLINLIRFRPGSILDRLPTLENNLTALNVTVYQLKDEVDHLQARLSNTGTEAPSAAH